MDTTVNPDELPQVNHRGGENPAQDVLTELDVKEALLLHRHGFSVKYIANWLDVSEGTIHKIVTNRTWKHIERGGR